MKCLMKYEWVKLMRSHLPQGKGVMGAWMKLASRAAFRKGISADLKRVYAAVDEQTALSELDNFDEKWSSKYPKIAISWRANWANLSTYFKYPEAVRTLIYTTNAIEGFNRQLRKVTKSKSVFPTDDSLLKMLYLAMIDITKKWTGKRKDWGQIHSQLEIFFADRLPQ